VPSTLLLVENASVPTDPRVWPECTTLRDAGWSVSVICPQGPGRDIEPEVEVEGIRIRRFPPRESSSRRAGYAREYGSALREIRRLVHRVAHDERFDVVHAATPPDFLLLAARRLRRRGAATILDHHDLSPELFEAKYGRRGAVYQGLLAAERLGFRLADVVISTNESFRQVAIDRGRMSPADVFVVRNGPDADAFRPCEPDPDIRGAAPFVLGYVGVMGAQDGVLEAISALAALRRRRSDWKAVFAGDGEVLTQAREMAARLGIGDAVTFTGFIGDREALVRLIASCDVCLSPEPPNALNERSTLIKVAEYMAVGKPVVAFDLPETRFTAGGAALYAATQDEFVANIALLLDDEAQRNEMGSIGRERVVEALGWRHSQAALLRAYERAVSHAAARRNT